MLLIRGYQLLVRPLMGTACRFEPSCSAYAMQAVCRHGAWHGGRLAAWRLLRCNPVCAGGYDPVPETLSRRPAPAQTLLQRTFR
jgi:putative membrane protein insertion efficiency factor